MSDQIPVFSIITPTCKRPGLLHRAIRSVQQQTFSDYEHIIIDDAHDAETGKIIQGINDNKIIFHQHSFQKGAAGAYNSGIQLAGGKFILFLDDDDEYLPTCLERINARFIKTDASVGFVWTGISIIQDDESGGKELITKVWPAKFRNAEAGIVAATTIGNGYGLCVRKECIDAVGMYDESLAMGQDADFLFRLAGKYDFETVPEILVRIHHHKMNQLTDRANDMVRLEQREKILERHTSLLERYPELYYTHYRHIAELSYSSGLKDKGRNTIYALVKHNPCRLLNYLDLIAFEVSGNNFFSALHLRQLKRSFRRIMKRVLG